MEQVEGVGGVVDVADAARVGCDGEAEESPVAVGTGRSRCAGQPLDGYLVSGRRGLDEVAVAAVRGQHVAVGDRQSERIIDRAARAERRNQSPG